MFSKKCVVTAFVSIASMALPAFSQSETPGKNEVSVQAFGSFVKSTTNNGIENAGKIYETFKKSCKDTAYLRRVMALSIRLSPTRTTTWAITSPS